MEEMISEKKERLLGSSGSSNTDGEKQEDISIYIYIYISSISGGELGLDLKTSHGTYTDLITWCLGLDLGVSLRSQIRPQSFPAS